MAADRSAARKRPGTPAPDRDSDARHARETLDLDRLIHERVRLGIVSALAASPSLSFNQLREILKVTDGNLSVHARKLEDAGYLACAKSFQGRVPRTEFSLTREGRDALERYLGHMEGLIDMVRGDG